MAKWEEVILDELVELDRKYANYQELHMFFYNEKDKNAKLIYDLKVSAYKDLIKKIKIYGD